MRTVGIDVSSDSFTAAVFDGSRVVASKSFSLRPGWSGRFAKWCTGQGVSVGSDWVVVENTGVYSAVVCYGLQEAGFRLSVVNPHQVQLRFRLRKTDEVDAARLAEYGYRFWDVLQAWSAPPQNAVLLEQLLGTRGQLLSTLQRLEQFMRSWQAHPVHDEGALQLLEAEVSQLRAALAAIEERIRALVSSDERLEEGCAIARSVPGVGEVLSWEFAVATDGFTDVRDGRQLCSYVGIAPHEYRSGRRVNRGSHSRGYGPGRLRRALYMASLTAVRVEGELRVYYFRKRGEGKAGLVVLNAVMNKIVHRVCACLRDGRYYTREYVGVAA